MSRQFLDFEQPIEELNQKIQALRMVGHDNTINLSEEITRLEAKSKELTTHVFSRLTPWQIAQLAEFREWLTRNGFDPDDPSLTIGHPCIGQVDLDRSFGTRAYEQIWAQLSTKLDVYQIRTSDCSAIYDYCWSDPDYIEQQIKALK